MTYTIPKKTTSQRAFREVIAEIIKPCPNPELPTEVDMEVLIIHVYFDKTVEKRIREIVKLAAPGWTFSRWWFPVLEEEF